MNAHQDLAIRALQNMIGDDAARARHAFQNYTPEEMGHEHGESGSTRAQVLAGYEAHDRKINQAIEWVKTR